jgi:UDP-N-acetylglucosamine 2-epimerase
MGARNSTKARPLVVTVFGTRPQFIKLAVLWRELEVEYRSVLIDSGQHYDWELAGALRRDTGLRRPNIHLGIGSAPAASQIGRVADALDRHLARLRPDAVLVIGDTSTTAGGSIAASYRGIPVGHIEAGLRSFDKSAPEEKNRIIADHLSRWKFCPTRTAMENLRAEGIRDGVYGVGDLMYQHWLAQHRKSDALELPEGLIPGQYYFVTAHRAENVDMPERLKELARILNQLDAPFVFPVHPRTKRNLVKLRLWRRLTRNPRAYLLPPIPYSVSLALVARAKTVLTDSGGLQREAFWDGTPCLILRDVTEWPELIAAGAGVLVGLKTDKVGRALAKRWRITAQPDKTFAIRTPAKSIGRILALHLKVR